MEYFSSFDMYILIPAGRICRKLFLHDVCRVRVVLDEPAAVMDCKFPLPKTCFSVSGATEASHLDRAVVHVKRLRPKCTSCQPAKSSGCRHVIAYLSWKNDHCQASNDDDDSLCNDEEDCDEEDYLLNGIVC